MCLVEEPHASSLTKTTNMALRTYIVRLRHGGRTGIGKFSSTWMNVFATTTLLYSTLATDRDASATSIPDCARCIAFTVSLNTTEGTCELRAKWRWIYLRDFLLMTIGV